MNKKSPSAAILDERAKELRREYYRQWRKRNPDKIKESNERYWMRKAQKLAEAEETR